MEFTKEDIAKIFGTYFGCKVQRCNSKTGEPTCPDDIMDMNLDVYSQMVSYGRDGTWFYKLMLKRISEITDEHAIKVALLAVHGTNGTEQSEVARFDDKVVVRLNGNIEVGICFPSCHILVASVDNEEFLPVDRFTEIIEFLRDEQYMIPYKGSDLFEYGIALPSDYTLTYLGISDHEKLRNMLDDIWVPVEAKCSALTNHFREAFNIPYINISHIPRNQPVALPTVNNRLPAGGFRLHGIGKLFPTRVGFVEELKKLLLSVLEYFDQQTILVRVKPEEEK